ncbi:hypothetical protein MKX03_006884, partial [Papaver bracteatum]
EPADPFSLVADELSLIAIGNRLRKMVVAEVLLLMASALNYCIAEITKMIHVACLLQDDVLDDTNTRRDVRSPNFTMGKKVPRARVEVKLKLLMMQSLIRILIKIPSGKTPDVKHRSLTERTVVARNEQWGREKAGCSASD